MKTRILMLVALAVVFSSPAWAQSADIAGGYSFINFDAGGRETVHGWFGNVAGNVTDRFGIVGDVSGHYEDGGNIHTFMGGVRANAGSEQVRPFAQFLVGGTRASGGGFSDTNLTLGVGGGLDLKVHDNASVRVVQFDWLPVKFSGDWDTTAVRLGFGLVFHVQ